MGSNPNVEFTYPRKFQSPTEANNARALEDYLRDRAWRKITTDELEAELILVNQTIQSGNYVPGEAGWIIRADGSAEFNDVTARGSITATSGEFTGPVTITGSGVLQSSATTTVPRYILSASGTYASISLSSGHASETAVGYLRVGGPTVPWTWLRAPVVTGVDSALTITGDSVRIESRSGYSATLQGHAGFSLESVTGDVSIVSTAATKHIYLGVGTTTYVDVHSDGLAMLDGQILADYGTVAAPGIAFEGDPKAGFYRVASNYMAAGIGGYIMQQWGRTSGGNKEVYLYGLPATSTNFVRYNGGTGQLGYSSSTLRIKKDIEPMTVGLSDLLRPVWFRYRNNDEIEQPEESSHEHQSSQFRVAEGDQEGRHAGHIAEWTAAVDPSLAIYNAEDPIPVNYEVEGLVAIAIADLQDVRRRVSALEQGSS